MWAALRRSWSHRASKGATTPRQAAPIPRRAAAPPTVRLLAEPALAVAHRRTGRHVRLPQPRGHLRRRPGRQLVGLRDLGVVRALRRLPRLRQRLLPGRERWRRGFARHDDQRQFGLRERPAPSRGDRCSTAVGRKRPAVCVDVLRFGLGRHPRSLQVRLGRARLLRPGLQVQAPALPILRRAPPAARPRRAAGQPSARPPQPPAGSARRSRGAAVDLGRIMLPLPLSCSWHPHHAGNVFL